MTKTPLSQKMAEKRLASKKQRSDAAKQRAKRTAENKNKPPLKIDFSQLDTVGPVKIDSNGKPMITFEPESQYREVLLEILDYGKGSGAKKCAAKKILKRKLGAEITRIYSSYMHMKWKSQRKVGRPPVSKASCDKYAAIIGESCLRNAITPRQLLEYWDEHITNFANKGMKYPPLSFLSSALAAEQVAASAFEITSEIGRKWRPGDFKKTPQKDVGHSFSDTSKLHPGLRDGLIRAGFDEIRTWPDRYLMSVQGAAKSMSCGISLYISPEIKPMAEWALENIYEID